MGIAKFLYTLTETICAKVWRKKAAQVQKVHFRLTYVAQKALKHPINGPKLSFDPVPYRAGSKHFFVDFTITLRWEN